MNDATRFTLNVQPVIPLSLNENVNLTIRTIMPVTDAESPAPGIPSASGLGDITQSFFFSPKQPIGGWILAAWPVLLWPAATDNLLGSEKWVVGPTVLALKQGGQRRSRLNATQRNQHRIPDPCSFYHAMAGTSAARQREGGG